MTRACPSCGYAVREQARFCPQCGRSTETRLSPGTPLGNGGYRIVRSISKGGMGAVYLAEDRHAFDRLCIVKQMLEYYDVASPTEKQRAQERFEEEGRTLASLSHPGIPQIYAFWAENDRFYIVMEYIRGDNLETFVSHEDTRGQAQRGRRLPQEEVILYTIQACRILEYLHSQPRPVVHQDIKPANLILEGQLGEVRLVDFGTARARYPKGAQPGNGKDESVYGTDGYAPPEQYRGQPEPRSDVFALAATAYHLLTDDDPRDHPFKWPKMETLPRELGLALQRALRTAPTERSTAEELRHGLEAISMPSRTLQAFTFPGGARIRSVRTLPTLCDEHWDAARSFLYNGDFQRWLRDLNRHDLVLAADDLMKNEDNHDLGLEKFLRVLDAGLPRPHVMLDQSALDLGGVARESALVRRLTAVNSTRGYTLATLSASQPWIEIYPETMHCWAHIPTDIRINIRAENLPFRSQQRGTILIASEDQPPIEVPVTARVSLARETWRLTRKALSAAFPSAWRLMGEAFGMISRVTGAINRFGARHAWVIWLLWLLCTVGIGVGIYYLPDAFSLHVSGYTLVAPGDWMDYVLPALLGPPMLAAILWLLFVLVSLCGAALGGFLKGVWESFVK
jgi:serine/threonine protein kinase